ncbi:hypothetical protein DFJ77DRAFT_243756 [Powellomyces hirtus]|nr:hypothetical protein DFJ77DRAFT_243756 [Powellomyces hirtus]
MQLTTVVIAVLSASASVNALAPPFSPRNADFIAQLEKRGTTNCGSGPGTPTDFLMPKVCDALAKNGQRTATIQLRNQRTSDHSFAYISKNYKSGDRVWVDRSTDDGKTWTQCGPFNGKISNDLSNKGYSMRACMDMVDGGHVCTPWYKEDRDGEHVKVGGKVCWHR